MRYTLHLHNFALFNLQVLSIKGVISFRNQHFWTHSDDLKAGSIHVHVSPTAIEANIISQVYSDLLDMAFTETRYIMF